MIVIEIKILEEKKKSFFNILDPHIVKVEITEKEGIKETQERKEEKDTAGGEHQGEGKEKAVSVGAGYQDASAGGVGVPEGRTAKDAAAAADRPAGAVGGAAGGDGPGGGGGAVRLYQRRNVDGNAAAGAPDADTGPRPPRGGGL